MTTWALVILLGYHSVVIDFPTGEALCREALKEVRINTSAIAFCIRRT